MSRYAIAVLNAKKKIVHRVIEGEGQDAALRRFFDENMADQYTKDDQGYFYFKEDYFDPQGPVGSMLEV